jgi:hypothetical protein
MLRVYRHPHHAVARMLRERSTVFDVLVVLRRAKGPQIVATPRGLSADPHPIAIVS